MSTGSLQRGWLGCGCCLQRKRASWHWCSKKGQTAPEHFCDPGLALILIFSGAFNGFLHLQAATEARKQVLKLDNLYTNKAVDALLNYETVKLFNNEALEVSQYDEYLVGYQVSALDWLSALRPLAAALCERGLSPAYRPTTNKLHAFDACNKPTPAASESPFIMFEMLRVLPCKQILQGLEMRCSDVSSPLLCELCVASLLHCTCIRAEQQPSSPCVIVPLQLQDFEVACLSRIRFLGKGLGMAAFFFNAMHPYSASNHQAFSKRACLQAESSTLQTLSLTRSA